MNTQEKQNSRRPPAPQSSSDRAGWIAMMVVALLGALVLGWATSLSAS